MHIAEAQHPATAPQAAAGTPPPSAAEMRRELADAIADRNAADRAARRAKDIVAKAEFLRSEAADAVKRLQGNLDAANRAAITRHAKVISDALRGGFDPPGTLPPAPADSAPLGAATARLDALSKAADVLAAERDKAVSEAGAAAKVCHRLADAILEIEAHAMAAELIAATRLCWELQDRLAGLALIDDKRHDGPRLREFQADLLRTIDRRKHEADLDPRLVESRYWHDFLDRHYADAERAWNGYRSRLLLDAAATMDDAGKGSQ